MPRRFNTAGPCDPARHYMVPPLRRAAPLRALVERGAFFVLHAPRQAGKTTTTLALARELTREGRMAAIAMSLAAGAPHEDIGAAELAILDEWRDAAEERLAPELRPPPWPASSPGHMLRSALGAWAKAVNRPLILFLDEVDSLEDKVLLSVLRQLHSGYPSRPLHFPSSVALIGLRDVRDYKVTGDEGRRLGSASPFNIKERSLTLPGFAREEVEELYAQHTAETGQVFEPGVASRVFELTDGQPWLVNALAQEMVEVIAADPTLPVTPAHVDVAKKTLIDRRDTHFDSLAERLREPRVRKIIEPILEGGVLPDMPEDDLLYALDLGLIRRTETEGVVIANPIYAEMIGEALTRPIRASMAFLKPVWLRGDGTLDPEALLDAFLAFWRLHAEALMGASPYHESAPHLVMMAFLHRVENGGGTLHRELAIGSGRLDLMLEYKGEKLAMELKVWRPGRPDPLAEGLEQIDEYLTGLGEETGWLVIFDRRPKAKKIGRDVKVKTRKTPSGRRVTVLRV